MFTYCIFNEKYDEIQYYFLLDMCEYKGQENKFKYPNCNLITINFNRTIKNILFFLMFYLNLLKDICIQFVLYSEQT